MIRTLWRHVYLLWVYVGLFFGMGFSQTIYVWTNGLDVNNGTSPATSVRTIQVGITKAIQNGWTDVRISQGLYVPSAGLNASAVGRGVLITNDNLQIRGGWEDTFSSQSGTTVLDGQSTVTNVLFITNANNLLVDRLTIMRGNATLANPLVGFGGGSSF